MHQGMAAAAAAVALGRRVDLYFSWWGLERLVRGNVDSPDLDRDDVNATMELRGIPTIRQLLDVVRDSGLARLYACSGSAAAIGLNPPEIDPKVDGMVGWTTILQRTQHVVERLTF